MHYRLEYISGDYNCLDSVTGDTFDLVVQRIRWRMQDNHAKECTIFIPIAFIEDKDGEVEMLENIESYFPKK